MSKRRRGQTRRPHPAALGTAVLSALIVGGVTVPAAAEAPVGAKITAIPDSGSRPVADGIPTLPYGSLSTPRSVALTPQAQLLAQYTAAELELSVLSARRSELQQEYSNALIAKAMADYAWRQTADALREARKAAEAAAIAAYQGSVKGPAGLDDSLGELGLLIPRAHSTPETESALADLSRAQVEERTAYVALTEAITAEQKTSAAYSAIEKEYKRKETAFLELKRRVAEAQSEADRQRELQEQNLGDYDAGQSNAGLIAAPKARQAVMHALSQRGKPYKWGDEGPNTYDCSGLMYWSYGKAGIRLNRVAKDQYYGTRAKPVAKSALLPGDLLFFATNPNDWRTIHHVGMYLGNGKMVHARTTGDVVKIAPVSMSSVDFATRVVDALPAPQSTPTATPTATASASATPRPTASATPPASSSPSASSSPTPQAGSSPEPEPAESASPVAQESTSPKASPEPSPSPSPAPAAG